MSTSLGQNEDRSCSCANAAAWRQQRHDATRRPPVQGCSREDTSGSAEAAQIRLARQVTVGMLGVQRSSFLAFSNLGARPIFGHDDDSPMVSRRLTAWSQAIGRY